MAKTSLILHVSEELARALPLTKTFEPVQVWDNENRQFLDRQETNPQGVPLWESSALLAVGWGADIDSVRIRMASQTKPAIEPDPVKLLAVLGQDTPSNAVKAAKPTQTTQTTPTRLEKHARRV